MRMVRVFLSVPKHHGNMIHESSLLMTNRWNKTHGIGEVDIPPEKNAYVAHTPRHRMFRIGQNDAR